MSKDLTAFEMLTGTLEKDKIFIVRKYFSFLIYKLVKRNRLMTGVVPNDKLLKKASKSV